MPSTSNANKTIADTRKAFETKLFNGKLAAIPKAIRGDVKAAIGVEQVKRIDEILSKRNQVAEWYLERLANESRIEWQHNDPDCKRSWFVFVVKLADEYSEEQRNQLIANLRERGIGCSNYFAPIHLQPFYMNEFGYKPGDFPVCERVAARTIALPFHNALTQRDIDEVGSALESLL